MQKVRKCMVAAKNFQEKNTRKCLPTAKHCLNQNWWLLGIFEIKNGRKHLVVVESFLDRKF
jgi:hypothetical protein